MKIKLAAVLSMLILQACGGGTGLEEGGPGASSNNGGSGGGNSSSIVGSWDYTHTGSQCRDIYRFDQSNTFQLQSLDEVATGTYTFTELQAKPSRYQLRMDTVADNGEADCLGISDNDTGVIEILYIEFGNNLLNVFSSPTSTGIVQVLRKT